MKYSEAVIDYNENPDATSKKSVDALLKIKIEYSYRFLKRTNHLNLIL